MTTPSKRSMERSEELVWKYKKHGYKEDSLVDFIALAFDRLVEEMTAKIESLDDQLSASLIEREKLVSAIEKYVDDYLNQGGLISDLQEVISKYRPSASN